MVTLQWAMKWCHFVRSALKLLQGRSCGKIGTVNDQHKFSTNTSCCPSVLGHLSLIRWKGRECKDGCHLVIISIYNGIHLPHGILREIHTSPVCPLCWTQNLGERAGLFLAQPSANLLSCLTAQCDFTVLFFGVPAGVVSKASHVSRSISVSTGPISLWPQPVLLFNCRRPKHEVIQVDCHVLPDNTGEACKYTDLPSHLRIHRQWCTKASKAGVLESLAPSRTFGQLSGFMAQWFTTRMANFQSTHFPEVKLESSVFRLYCMFISVNQEEHSVLPRNWGSQIH